MATASPSTPTALVEAADAHRRLFGLRRLTDVLNANAHRPLQDVKYIILDAVRRHTGGSLRHDDVTLLLAEIR